MNVGNNKYIHHQRAPLGGVSTSTAVVVGLVSAGQINVHKGFPISIGTNIGTPVTNTMGAKGCISAKGAEKCGGDECHMDSNFEKISSSSYRKDLMKCTGCLSAEAEEKCNMFGILSWSPVPIVRRGPLVDGLFDVNMGDGEELFSDIVEKKDDYKKSCERFGECDRHHFFNIFSILSWTPVPISKR